MADWCFSMFMDELFLSDAFPMPGVSRALSLLVFWGVRTFPIRCFRCLSDAIGNWKLASSETFGTMNHKFELASETSETLASEPSENTFGIRNIGNHNLNILNWHRKHREAHVASETSETTSWRSSKKALFVASNSKHRIVRIAAIARYMVPPPFCGTPWIIHEISFTFMIDHIYIYNCNGDLPLQGRIENTNLWWRAQVNCCTGNS